MNRHLSRKWIGFGVATALLFSTHAGPALAQAAGPAGADVAAPEQGWPRAIQAGDETFTVYQPQLGRWQNNRLQGRAAVAVETKANPQPKYGVIWFAARTDVDRESRIVSLSDVTITKANFPASGDDQERIVGVLKEHVAEWSQPIALDRIEALLTIARAEQRTPRVAVKNDPPRILVSTKPAVLFLVDGEPALRPAGPASLMRVINTRVPLWLDRDTGSYWLALGDRLVRAASLEGPWTTAVAPAAVAAAAKAAIDAEKQAEEAAPGSEGGQAAPGVAGAAQAAPPPGELPVVYVSTVPAELIVLDGKAKFAPIEGTELLAATNTTANVFVDVPSQQTYVLLSGRWFRAGSLAGPWQYVPQAELPAEFARIPENDPKGGVLASVAGTPSAQEAAIANTIPQTATVKRAEARFAASYDGDPRFEAIEGTPLAYAANAPMPVIRVDAKSYYAVSNGVWFAATAPSGPWVAADRVPAVIYTIPPSSPLHYVTYVRVYDATPDVVYVGYTPGYMGSYLADDGVVVYGTGWPYRPWIGNVWYGPPVTWGFSVGFGWTSWGGWGWNFGLGWHPWWGFGPFYHPWWGPWWGFHGWGGGWYGGWRGWWGPGSGAARLTINNVNVYNHWSRSVVVNRSVSAAGVRPPASAAHGGAAKVQAPNNVFAGRNGSVYRRGENGWQQHNGTAWQPVRPGGGGEGVRSLERENYGRALGESRIQSQGLKAAPKANSGPKGQGGKAGGKGKGRRK